MSRSMTTGCVLAVLMLFGGCAATVQRGAGEPPFAVPDAAKKKVVLAVVGDPSYAGRDDWGYLVDEWQSSMSWAAQNRQMAFAYEAPGAAKLAGAGTRVTIKINDYRFVSTAKRWMTGIFSGNAFIDADVSFADMSTGRVLGTRHYNSSSSALHGVFAAMTERQLEAISTEIVGEVAGR